MLKSSLSEKSFLIQDLTEEHMKEMVNHTFAAIDGNGDGKISFEEYSAFVEKNPTLLNAMK